MKAVEQASENGLLPKKISAKAYEDALILLRALELMLEKADALGQGPEDERVRCLLDRHTQLVQSLLTVEILPPENDARQDNAASAELASQNKSVEHASISQQTSETATSQACPFENAKALYQGFYQCFGVKLSQNEAQILFDYLHTYTGAKTTQAPELLQRFLKQQSLKLPELLEVLQAHTKWKVFRALSGLYSSPRHVFETVKERCSFELSKAQATALFHFFNNGTFDGHSLAEPADFQRLSRLLEEIRPHLSQQPELWVERLK